MRKHNSMCQKYVCACFSTLMHVTHTFEGGPSCQQPPACMCLLLIRLQHIALATTLNRLISQARKAPHGQLLAGQLNTGPLWLLQFPPGSSASHMGLQNSSSQPSNLRCATRGRKTGPFHVVLSRPYVSVSFSVLLGPCWPSICHHAQSRSRSRM